MPNFQNIGELISQPGDQPTAIRELYRVVGDHSAMLDEINKSFFTINYVAPDKPREGMLRVADGTDWNPGSGAGLYRYSGGTWNKL